MPYYGMVWVDMGPMNPMPIMSVFVISHMAPSHLAISHMAPSHRQAPPWDRTLGAPLPARMRGERATAVPGTRPMAPRWGSGSSVQVPLSQPRGSAGI